MPNTVFNGCANISSAWVYFVTVLVQTDHVVNVYFEEFIWLYKSVFYFSFYPLVDSSNGLIFCHFTSFIGGKRFEWDCVQGNGKGYQQNCDNCGVNQGSVYPLHVNGVRIELVWFLMGMKICFNWIFFVFTQRRIVGLHQITSIGSTDITDTWEPLEEGLLP